MGIRKLVVLLCFAWLAGCGRKQPPASPANRFAAVPAVLTGESRPRPVLPYSVIPGGVQSADELQTAIETDTVVAAHYAGVDVKGLRPVTLQRDTAAYVSFRMNGKVYWTSRKVRLAAGERIFEGREAGVRGRCGNQVSATPRTPVLDNRKLEPSGETLSTPLAGIYVAPADAARTAAPAQMPVDAFASDHSTVVSMPQPSSLGWSTFGAVPVGGGGGGGVVAMGGGGGGAAGPGSVAANASTAPVIYPAQPLIPSATPVLFASYSGSPGITIFPVAPYTPVTSIPVPYVAPPYIAPPPSVVYVQLPPPAVPYPPVWTYVPPGTPTAPPPADTPVPPGTTPPVICCEPVIPQCPIPVKFTPPPGTPTETPEPSTWVMLMAGAGVLGIKKLRW